MFILYDLIFLVVAIICLPRYLFRRKFHRGFLRRLGILPKDLKLDRPIWIHAVSVGEVMAVRGLLEQLRVNYPAKSFVISTVTPTGNKIARGLAQPDDFITYLPLDFSFIVKNVIERINPEIFIIAETELWPNLVGYLYRKHIPVVLVNGRISDVSFKGYLAIKSLLRSIFNKVSLFCVQTSLDGERFSALGVPQNKIRVSGSMKFDVADLKKDTTDYTDKKSTDCTDYKQKLGLEENEKLLVAGSTHSGEEEIILRVYKELLDEFPDLRLLIAPRHPERAKELAKFVSSEGFSYAFISNLERTTPHPLRQAGQDAGRTTVFILDTIGQLLSFYSLADIVFVGGSLIRKGGHNILEPASLSKPILFGPHMFNFRDIAQLFLRNNAAILVRNKEELKEKIKYLLGNPRAMDELGKRAKALILENQGATLRNLETIKNLYERTSL